jgi:hypothetical protein
LEKVSSISAPSFLIIKSLLTMELKNSTRVLPKVTHVPLTVDEPVVVPSRALHKSTFLRSLALRTGEVDRALRQDEIHHGQTGEHQSHGVGSGVAVSHEKKPVEHSKSQQDIESLLRLFEGKKLPLEYPSPSTLAEIPASQLLEFGKRVLTLRQTALEKAKSRSHELAGHVPVLQSLGHHYNLVQTAQAASAVFSSHITVSPVGMLNLERLEMAPAGIEKGELLATIPLAPREKTLVVQQEWSSISQEFTSIVTDSLENYSETGVTENTELAQATTSQNSHANQFNVTSSASGGCGFVTGSVSAGFSAQDQSSTSATDSMKHAMSVTKKASSRVTQSRKVTISTNTVSGSSTSTTRTLENPSDTQSMTICYFSMMRKWHVGLYRYGLRLTYDLTVPEPGAAMRELYAEMDKIEASLTEKFTFPLTLNDIDEQTYSQMAANYGVKLPPLPPASPIPLRVAGSIPNLKEDNDSSWIQNEVSITIKDGYEVGKITLDLILSNWDISVRVFSIVGVDRSIDTNVVGQHQDRRIGIDLGNFLVGQQGTLQIVYFAQYYGNGMYAFNVDQVPTAATRDVWRASVLSSIYDAALADFTANQTLRQSKLQALKDQLNAVDTLTLRREENDEIMKCVLRWLLGPDFQFVPDDVVGAFENPAPGASPGTDDAGDSRHGIHFTGNKYDPGPIWSVMLQHGRTTTFLNEAIEWENVVFFLYSYFWDDPLAWPFIHTLTHPDATRQAFLRAGSARVVLTIRKGFEKAFTWFAEYGSLDNLPDDISHYPYLRIAEDISNYDNTNYKGIPPANPTGSVNIGGQQAGTVGMGRVDPGTNVSLHVEDTSGFAVDNIVVIDTSDSGLQERQKITQIKQAQNIIVVAKLENRHGAKGKDEEYPIIQVGEEGVLIAEWFEYTPSHGTAIEVDAALETMS